MNTNLTPRERYILAQGLTNGRTRNDIAKGLGITPTRVYQLEAKGMEKLRVRLLEWLSDPPADDSAARRT